MGGIVLGILVWQEGGESVGALLAVGVVALGAFGVVAACAASGTAKPTLIDPDLFSPRCSGSGSPSRCCNRSPSAAR